jgi:hypothetical protein
MADPRPGRAIFDQRVEYPLPKRRGVKDFPGFVDVTACSLAVLRRKFAANDAAFVSFARHRSMWCSCPNSAVSASAAAIPFNAGANRRETLAGTTLEWP